MSSLNRLLSFVAILLLVTGVTACSDDDDDGDTPSPAATSSASTTTSASQTSATTASESTSTATSQTSSSTAALAAPSDVSIEGELPDLNTPVPPGQGELGRITVSWQDNSEGEDGFRVYQECGGTVTQLLEVEADVTSYGPLQTCRPGRIGVAAFMDAEESEIAWAE